MRRSLVVLLALVAWPSSAAAAPVLVRAQNGTVGVKNDPFVAGPSLTPAPARRPPRGERHRSARGAFTVQLRVTHGQRASHGRPRRRPVRTVLSVLGGLYRGHVISPGAFAGYLLSFRQALGAEHRLRGTRRRELSAVTENLHQMAVSGTLTPSRLPVLFETLDRNRQWWTSGPLLSYGQRVEFSGSQLVWEYYPGQGIELQVLGSFGKADGLYSAGVAHYQALVQLLGEMIPLAAHRAGGLTWEYYFNFDGGVPPWTSAMSQATGLEALTRGYQATGKNSYLDVAARALSVFTGRPPSGVTLATPLGVRFLQYTFAPRAAIINAFLQTLIGLHVYARASGNPVAAGLFARGNREALAEVPRFDTGAWSLYQPGIEDSLDYHQLVTGFLAQMCSITRAPVYCSTAQRFQTYLKTPPALTQLTWRGRPQRRGEFRFSLSKYSRVGISVSRAGRTSYLTSAYFPYGTNSFAIPGLRPGSYAVVLTATDLAGNFSRLTGTLTITR